MELHIFNNFKLFVLGNFELSISRNLKLFIFKNLGFHIFENLKLSIPKIWNYGTFKTKNNLQNKKNSMIMEK